MKESNIFLDAIDLKPDVHQIVKDEGVSSKELIDTINMPNLEIPDFDGNPKDYHSFIAMFDKMVGKSNKPNKAKLTRLIQFTIDDAHKAIRPCLLMDENVGYANAREILHERFGDTHLVTQKLINDLRDNMPIKTAHDLQEFDDELKNCAMVLSQMGKIHEVQSQMYIVQIAERLQPYIRNRWKRKAMEIKNETKRYPKFEEFVEFVHIQTAQETDPVYGKAFVKSATKDVKKKSSAFSSNANQNSRGYKCVICKSEHRLIHCSKFKEMKPADRLHIIVDNKLCHICFYSNHATAECRRMTGCEVPGCNGRHNKFIHVSRQVDSANDNSNVKSPVKVVNANANVSGDVHMPTVAVRINGE